MICPECRDIGYYFILEQPQLPPGCGQNQTQLMPRSVECGTCGGSGEISPINVVRPGQVWADNDKREKGRRLIRVVLVDEVAQYALVAPYTGRDNAKGRVTRIRLNRFKPTSTGYRLVIANAEKGF